MANLHWYLRRLRVMTPAEVRHRLEGAATLGLLRVDRHRGLRPRSASTWRQSAFCAATAQQLPNLAVAFDPTPAEAARLLRGEWGALGFDWQYRRDSAVWHTAPDTGRAWPLSFFGAIDFRPGNPYGDARVVWEPARLQALVELALLAEHDPQQAARATELIEDVLECWVRANPYLSGVHYIASMECALRVIAVCHALDRVREHLRRPAVTWSSLLWLLESHAALIVRRLSRHSSSGNHTIAECAGLIYSGILWPEHPDAARWVTVGRELLAHESARQVLPDGGGIERTPWYHLFVLDLLGLVDRLLQTRGPAVPSAVTAAIERGRCFLGALATAPDELPSLGDADGGYALTRHLRISFARASTCGNAIAPARVSTFPDTGYTVCRRRTPGGLWAIADHGPLGMEPGFGHGHADALSLIVGIERQPLLLDPGTFTYGGGPEWRKYFRSTRAHNTVTVDGLDQSVQEGPFLWSQPYQARLVAQRGPRLLMRHGGYARVGVVHYRGVYLTDEGELLVWDRLEGKGEHLLELNWHLGIPAECATLPAGILRLTNGYGLSVAGGLLSLHSGELHPPLGWASPRYGRRAPITTLRSLFRGALPHEFVTLVVPNGERGGLEPKLAALKELRACLESNE